MFGFFKKRPPRIPSTDKQRKCVKDEAHTHQFGKELVDQEAYWDEFADGPEFMLAVYKQGKETIVDVLRASKN